MSQSARSSSTVNRTDGTNRSTKPTDSLRPHFYTTFQSSCCGEKTNSTTSTQNKNLLPIPDKFKTDAENLLTFINQDLIENLAKITEYTSVIPNIFFEKNDNYQTQRYLIDRGMLKTLEDAYIINRIPILKTLYPIRTSGNGNCLLHAVLIAMIGIHDCNLYLRDRLAQFMNDNKDLLQTHWQIERLKTDKIYGISSEDSKLDDEWKELCDLVHYENSEDGQAATQLQFLEAVHIFSISNMLHRPIIILSEDVIRNKNNEAISVNDLFGIYLPILSSSNECINEPIVLAYDRSHFCPLQTNDINLDRTSDNFLPLYPSINHIYEQTVLPIRFLGDDITVEHSRNLLRDYLRIKEVDYSFDSNSQPIPVLCAELGSKHLSSKGDFFLLYHKYLTDFFEIQKPRAIEEEQKRDRQREYDDYMSRYGPYDTYDRSIGKQDTFPTGSSRSAIEELRNRERQRELNDDISLHAPYDTYGRPIVKQDTFPTRSPRSNYTMSDIQPRNQTTHSYQQYDVNNNGTYIPRDGPIYVENSPIQSQRLPDYTKQSQRDPTADYTDSKVLKPLHSTNNTDNISNLNNNGKLINTFNINIQENDSRFEPERQQQKSIQIPVQIMKPSVSSNNQHLTIYEQRRAPPDKCLLCNRLFDDIHSRRFCPQCDGRIQNVTSYDDVPRRSSSRSRSTNIYLPEYDRGYTSILSPVPKARPQRKIICPHCKNPNLLYSLSSNSDFRCSACQNLIPSAYPY